MDTLKVNIGDRTVSRIFVENAYASTVDITEKLIFPKSKPLSIRNAQILPATMMA